MILLVALLVPAVPALTLQRGPLPSPVDAELEEQSAHNLDVGKQYFKRKAYEGAKDRLLEIVSVYPEYSKIDEVYYLLARTMLRLKKSDEAKEYLNLLLEQRPESSLAESAREELEKLGGN